MNMIITHKLNRSRLIPHLGKFSKLSSLTSLPESSVDAIIFDIGLSSNQIADESRGFSFNQENAPLDMRFSGELINTTNDLSITAETVVNNYSEEQLTEILTKYGEEWKASGVARSIVKARQVEVIDTTGKLADIVAKSIGWKNVKKRKNGFIHPATKTFQALRIYVNNEVKKVYFSPSMISLVGRTLYGYSSS